MQDGLSGRPFGQAVVARSEDRPQQSFVTASKKHLAGDGFYQSRSYFFVAGLVRVRSQKSHDFCCR